nr:MAG TPA: protein of unknown function DUF1424 [Caudoviricetes sp.]
MYVKEIVKAGPVIEVKKYHSSRYRTPAMPRTKNKSRTNGDQWIVNERNSIRKLRLLILENFTTDDIRIDLTYAGEEPTEAEATKRLNNFLQTLRRRYKKAGQELKWIVTTECNGHRIHHHILINNIGWGRKEYQALWPWSAIPYRAFTYYDGKPADAERVAKYLVKETRKTYCQKDRCQRSRYRASRNLRKPKIEKEIIKSKTWREPKPVPGYYIEKPVQYGYTAYGYPYMFYRMIREDGDSEIPHQKKPEKDRKHYRRPGKRNHADKERLHEKGRGHPLRGSRKRKADG